MNLQPLKFGTLIALVLLFIVPSVHAQSVHMAALNAAVASSDDSADEGTPAELTKPKFDIYGFAMLDTGYQGKQNDPNWFDVVRPTKLPAFENQFGEDGRWFAGVRQSRFGVKSYFPTDLGEL
ncbi:hypothetical protein L0244_06990, partial [bacterium]|nr:hypothetical protein [bacterium]